MNSIKFSTVMAVTLHFMVRFALLSFSYGVLLYFFPWVAVHILIVETLTFGIVFYWMLKANVIVYKKQRV
jgi:hypothetical protein